MGYVVSQLQAVLSLVDQGFSSGMKKAREETKQTTKDVEESGKRFEKLGSSLGRIGSSLSLAVTVPLLALGRQAIKTATDFDSLKKGMIAVEGSSDKAERAIKRLEQTAKLPGLGFKEAQQGYINLRAAGQGADLATRSLEAFGNALVTVGRGKSELDGVVIALGQIESKGKVSAEEINQIAERVPQIRQIMLDAFGSADTEIIQRAGITSRQFVETIVGELEKLPKVAGGIRNDFENATDSIEKSLNRLGTTLAPKAATGLNYIADKIEKLSLAWDKLPKGNQDLLANLGIAALAVGPGLVAMGKLAELVSLLGQLKGVMPVGLLGGLGKLGLVGAVAATVAVGGTYLANKIGSDADKERNNLSQENPQRIYDIQQKLPALRKSAERWKGMGSDYYDGYSQRMEEIKALENEMLVLQRAQARQAVKSTLGMFSPSNLLKSTGSKRGPALDVAALAARKRAEAEAKKEAERLRKQAAAEAKRHAEDFARNTQEGRDELALLNAPNEFARQRREAEQKRRDNLKGMDKKVAEEIYQAELKNIAKLEQEAKDRAWEDGLGTIAKLLKADINTLEKQREFERRGLEKWGVSVDRSMTSSTKAQSSSILSTIQSQIRRQKAEDKQLKSIEGGMGGWADGLISSLTSTVRTQEGARQRLQEHHARVNGRQVAGDLSRGASDFAYDLLQGRGAGQAAKRVSQTLINALNQGAAKEIERVVARSLTDPISKAIERGFDPVASKLSRSIEASTKGLRMSAEDILASAYGLYAIANRKKKFGIGTVLGGIGGFLIGGPGGVIPGANFGNALDNGDIAGAVTGGLVYAGGKFASSGSGPQSSPGAPADGRSVVIHASGWTVNREADETRLVNNMARRVRVASVVGG